MDAAKKSDKEDFPSKNPQESPSSHFATHPLVCFLFMVNMSVDVQ